MRSPCLYYIPGTWYLYRGFWLLYAPPEDIVCKKRKDVITISISEVRLLCSSEKDAENQAALLPAAFRPSQH